MLQWIGQSEAQPRPSGQDEARPIFSLGKFLEKAQEFIPEEDYNLLVNLPEMGDVNIGVRESFSARHQAPILLWEVALRNELVKIRAGYKHIDASEFLRSDDYLSIALAHIAQAARRNPSILEAEKFLDRARWDYLEELSTGHFFDLEFLIIYAYKLKILERWEKVRIASKEVLLEEQLKY